MATHDHTGNADEITPQALTLTVIAFRLNGRRLKRTLSKREVIELAGSAQR
jgi:hypothetical protein